jgi:hypothetical protein
MLGGIKHARFKKSTGRLAGQARLIFSTGGDEYGSRRDEAAMAARFNF